MDVFVDSTSQDVAGEQIFSSEWDIDVPLGLTAPTNASIPNPNDFYEGWSPGNMDFDEVDQTMDGNRELTSNNRATSDWTGPMNSSGKKIGSYWFDVDDNSSLGYTQFSTNEVRFLGNPNFFSTFAPLSGTTMTNYQFRIMPHKGDVTGNRDWNNSVDVFVNRLLGTDNTIEPTETYFGEYCDWAGNDDGVLDARDIQGFVNNYIANYGQ